MGFDPDPTWRMTMLDLLDLVNEYSASAGILHEEIERWLEARGIEQIALEEP